MPRERRPLKPRVIPYIPEDAEMTATEEVLFNFAKVATEALQSSEKA